MPEALEASAYVYQGLWTKWSEGKVYGITLTLSPRNTAILVACVALFVQLSGAQLWGVLRFAFHQSRMSKRPEDGLYHQQQAVLRNSTSDLATSRQLLLLAWAWRHRAHRPFVRNLSLIFLALFHFTLFGFAGIFSSKIIQAGQEVLIRSPFCGTLNSLYVRSLDGLSTRIEFQSKMQRDAQLSQQYIRSCYNKSETSSSCEVFKKKQLSWQTNLTDVCPFDSSVCLNQSQTITHDTGLLDSHNDLGLNAKESDRVSYRRTTACTPLNDAAYVADFMDMSVANKSSVSKVVSANYGAAVGNNFNATFRYSNFTNFATDDQKIHINPYQLNIQNAGYDFSPIAELNLSDSEVFLAFLTFERHYDTPVDDPWFSAHRPARAISLDDGNNTAIVYGRDRPITTLGCAVQHQFCINNPSSSSRNCTPLAGWSQVQNGSTGVRVLNMNPRQNVTYQRIESAAKESDISIVITSLAERDTPLLAVGLIHELIGQSLPNHQWQIETNYWHSLSMAHLQRIFLEWATGQKAVDTSYIQRPTTPEDKWICDNQMIRGTSFQSFSVFKLSLIFLFGILIIVLSLVIEDLVGFLQRRWSRGAFGRMMWIANETLEFQRVVFEQAGQGTWHYATGAVPVTELGQKLELLDPAGVYKTGSVT